MMRPKTFLRTIKKTLTQPAYYFEIMQAKFWFVFRFFSLSLILLGLLMAVRFNQRSIPQLKTGFNQALAELKNNYPVELMIEWDGSKLELSTDDPITIGYPSNWPGILPAEIEQPTQLAYLTDQDLTSDEINKEFTVDSWFVIDQDQLFVSDLNQGWNSQLLSPLFPEPRSISAENLDQFINEIQQTVESYLQAIQASSYFVIPLALIMTTLWTLLIESVILFLLFKLNRLGLNFGQTFKFSLQVGVVAELVNQLSIWLYPDLNWPMFSLTFWLVTIYVFWTQRRQFYRLEHKKGKKT